MIGAFSKEAVDAGVSHVLDAQQLHHLVPDDVVLLHLPDTWGGAGRDWVR